MWMTILGFLAMFGFPVVALLVLCAVALVLTMLFGKIETLPDGTTVKTLSLHGFKITLEE